MWIKLGGGKMWEKDKDNESPEGAMVVGIVGAVQGSLLGLKMGEKAREKEKHVRRILFLPSTAI